MERINQINFESLKNNTKKEEIGGLIDTISECFGIPKSVLKKVFED